MGDEAHEMYFYFLHFVMEFGNSRFFEHQNGNQLRLILSKENFFFARDAKWSKSIVRYGFDVGADNIVNNHETERNVLSSAQTKVAHKPKIMRKWMIVFVCARNFARRANEKW